MPLAFKIYTCAWILACLASLVLCLRSPSRFEFTQRSYFRFLTKRWKVITFAIATAGMVVVAPWSGDPTWDVVDASFMAVLTYFTSPWVVGVLYRLYKKKAPAAQVFVALCMWMFSASWSYDIYVFLRDNVYPITWLANIPASSVLYLCGGLFWNLDHREGRGVHFSFTKDNWPSVSSQSVFRKIFVWALPFMVLVAVMLGETGGLSI